MSWLFSRALVAEYSAGTCSDGAPSAPSNGNPIPHAYLPSDRMTAFSRLSRFGMTFAHLTDDRGAELLTSYLAAFPVRTSAQPEKAQASKASEAACGARWHELSVKYCRVSSSWKTHRSLWEEDLPWSSVTLPKWGSMRDGVCLERMMSERPTSATDAGLWQTPVADDACNRATGKWNSRGEPKLSAQVKLWRTPTVSMLNADRAKDPEYTARKEAKGQTITLADQVKHERLWPTPDARDSQPEGIEAGKRRLMKYSTCGLQTAVKLKTPTPSANDWKGSSKDGQRRGQLTDPLMGVIQAGGQLNPTWVEWLMGWPLGWTDLKPLATDRSHSAQQQHGESCQKV